jgi:hypothetical protein
VKTVNLMSYCSSVVLAVLVLLAATVAKSQGTADAGGEIRELLVDMKGNHRSTKQLATLFRAGDEKIEDLIAALSDPDKKVRLRAQIVIRYLGNDRGMKSWSKVYKEDQEVSLSAPIPIPVSDADYDFVRSQYLKEGVKTEALMDACLFALALDGSPPAMRLLSEVILNVNQHGFKLQESRYIGARGVKIGADVDLPTAVLREAPFLDASDRKAAMARVIAYSGASNKALIEIHVNRGPLAQEWYHVVMKRVAKDWTIFSITQVAIS